MKWTRPEVEGLFGPSTNEILDGDGFYISYNETPGGGLSLFAPDVCENDIPCNETALVEKLYESKEEDVLIFRILNGDFREEYEEAFPKGFDACLAVYDEYKEDRASSWSDEDEWMEEKRMKAKKLREGE